MPTLTVTQQGRNRLSRTDATTGPILVALDGTDSSEPALVFAAELARRTKAAIRIVAVFEPLPQVSYEIGVLPASASDGTEAHADLRRRVEEQVRKFAWDLHQPDISVRNGRIAEQLAAAARELEARVLILGVRHRSLVDRIFGREISLQVLRRSTTPVHVIPAGYATMPERMVLATDFSAGSVVAARLALELYRSVRHVSFVHVLPRPNRQLPAFSQWLERFGEKLERAFDCLKADLTLDSAMTVETVTLEGTPAEEIVKFARTSRADLIVTGSRGAGLVDRLLVGSTARGVMRGASCGVLAVRPPALLNIPYGLLTPDKAVLHSDRWMTEVDDFGKRNMGRLMRLDIEDTDCGAHTEVDGYPLSGISYDPRQRQLSIMVGTCDEAPVHLTRNISGVESIEILRDALGRDWTLRISHTGGQTLLTVLSGWQPPIVTSKSSDLV